MTSRLITAVICLLAIETAAVRAQPLVGDCDESLAVDVSDLVRGINIVLGRRPVADCASLDVDADGRVTVDELIAAVVNALSAPPDCGDLFRNADEQCDDGNRTDGDGCDGHCVLEGTGTLDQRWLGATPGCAMSTGQTSITALAPLGQEFRPSLAAITTVSVNVAPDSAPSVGLHLLIHAGAIDGPVVASADGVAEPPLHGGWHRFDLPVVARVTPGALYVIELRSDANLLWVSNQAGPECAASGYPGGARIVQGEVDPGDDYRFAVFGLAVSRDADPHRAD